MEVEFGSAPVAEEVIKECLHRSEGRDLEGFLLGQGAIPATIMFVGEAPGATEIVEGRPFTGQAGKVLEAYLEKLGLTRRDIYITSAVRSRPFKDKVVAGTQGTPAPRISRSNRTPTKNEVLAHAAILDAEIAAVRPKVIVPLGNIGLHRLIGSHETISSLHGRVIEGPILQLEDSTDSSSGYTFGEKSYSIFPLYHPAAVIYNRSLETVIDKDLEKLKAFLASKNNS
ncbi:uracil-DNA glycosylase [Saccharibacillus sp. CPCC 101409]|uniref:uracil-DNA glycosylase n=1 Tax=Saccharibacillus sp. CPCC 101409 TaxID=3058041 RepID=UPI0026729B13|nr:uracil-DNA glycosylase [Saccharibacillus sp. CPCC 101409]MDO3409509.1 uracil-DNA glycosylase [Saccharibacillus sp. CPCC 101409]